LGEVDGDESQGFLSAQDVAELLNVPANTICKWNKARNGPP
jgi:DNA-binding transcriptional regulator YiaG